MVEMVVGVDSGRGVFKRDWEMGAHVIELGDWCV